MTVFKAGDFAEQEWQPISSAQAASIANQKLQREAKVVYGQVVHGEFLWNHTSEYGDTHRALLVCIAPLEKPKCEHIEIVHLALDGRYSARCKKCDKEMKPTGWEVVDEQR